MKSNPQKPEIIEYITPSDEEIKARSQRNIAIAWALVGFMGLVFLGFIVKAMRLSGVS